jgi:hypothetical protein
VVLIVAGFIALLNVAVITAVLGQTGVGPFGGVTEVTVGAAHGAEVVNVHTKLAASALPNTSCAPVVIVAVKVVLGARLAEGVKVAVMVAAA